MAITKDDIFNAADSILDQGGNPTLASVRKLLGGGSYTTIGEAMTEWRTRQQIALAASTIREPAPEAVTSRLNEFSGEIWSLALEVANNKLQAERKALEQARLAFKNEKIETAELADQLTSELEQANEKIKEQHGHIDAATEKFKIQERILSSLTNDLHTAQNNAFAANTALAEAHKYINRTTKLLETEQATNIELSKKLEQSVETSYAQKSELIRLEAELKAMRQRAETAEDIAQKATAEAVELRRQLAITEDRMLQLARKVPDRTEVKAK
ncbi:MAG TPA: DNA-binding protein [Methylobacter sp.]|jgi:chromosome segregation ATPase